MGESGFTEVYMNLDLNDHTLEIPCSACGEKIPEKIGRLKDSPTLTCTRCGAHINVDATELKRGIESIEKSIDDLRKKLKGMFK